MNASAYPKGVAYLTILSGLLAFVCLALLGIALADNPAAFDDPMQLLTMPNLNVTLVRWSMLADLFGYYLLLLPVIFCLQTYLREQTPWADLATYCGTAYVLVGAIGAVIMSEVVCPLLAQYAAASPAEQPQLRTPYQTMNRMVYDGLWNLLETLLAGVWWTMTGVILQTWHRPLGWFTIALGLSTSLDALGNLFGLKLLAAFGLNLYLLLAPLWAIWIGVLLWQRTKVIIPTPKHRQTVAAA